MRPRLVLFALACWMIGIPGTALGQSTRFAGLSVIRFHDEYGRFHLLTYRRTDLGRSGGGGDMAAGLHPSLAGGVLLMQLDFGIARAVPVGPARLLFRAGSGNFVALARTLEVYPGVLLGTGALIRIERANWVRVDLSRHLYYSGDESFHMWSLGIGFAVASPP